jgi:predicted short-subunit dehydrogenase-like oxidoreductase (DUF2520 family)
VTRDDRPLAGLRFVLVGPGRVGESLACWAVACGARCEVVAGRPGSPRTAPLAERLGARASSAADLDPVAVDFAFLMVPEAELADVARRAAGRLSGVALHGSGALGASVLAPLAAAGCTIGTFHPLRAFPVALPDLARARGTFFALDGDAPARSLGRRLATAFGGEAGVVPEAARTAYHLAATLAGGGVTTVLAAAWEVARRAGVPAAALRGYGELARGALEAALAAADPAEAITGPAARGETETIERQLAALEAEPAARDLVVALARVGLERRTALGAPTAAQRALAERLSRPELLDRSRVRVLASKPRP